MSRLSVSILLAIVAIALVAPTATASLSNPTGAELKAFVDRYPTIRRQMIKALKLEANGPPEAGRKLLGNEDLTEEFTSGRKLLCSDSCTLCMSALPLIVPVCACIC
jgi:hypothetical protein